MREASKERRTERQRGLKAAGTLKPRKRKSLTLIAAEDASFKEVSLEGTSAVRLSRVAQSSTTRKPYVSEGKDKLTADRER